MGKVTAAALLLALLVAEAYSQYPVILEAPARRAPTVIRIRQPAYIPPQAAGSTSRSAPKPSRERGNPNESNLLEESSSYGNPDPYSFGYDVRDEFGNHQYRKEEADGRGVVRGTYGYTDAAGIFRFVDYIADSNGFKANIRSNEPGIGDANAADVTLVSEDPPRGYLELAANPKASPLPGSSRLSGSGNQALTQIKPLSSPSARVPVYTSPSAAPTGPTPTNASPSPLPLPVPRSQRN